MKNQVLIADNRKELSTKYKRIIESLGNSVVVSGKLNEILKKVQDFEPDLILISDSIDEDAANFCKKLRVLTFNTRPIIIVISKSAELNDRLKALESGADDFLSEPIRSEEFKMRIHAHLRREQEIYTNTKTGLANKEYTLKEIKRENINEHQRAFILFNIENFEEYKSIYTNLAADKLLQTYIAIIRSALMKNDFLGQLSENKFFAITDPMYVEKIVSFLTFAFDSIVEKFYSKEDLKRGYMILQGDEKEGRRCEFVHTVISVVTNEYKKYSKPAEVINLLYEIKRKCTKPAGSSYLIDRVKISGENSIDAQKYNNLVLVLEQDEALSFLLKTAISLQGYEVVTSLDEIFTEPAIIILDAGDAEELNGLKLYRQIKNKGIFKNSKTIVTSTLHDKEKILNEGVDLYLPKPYNILTLINWVDIFLKEFNN